MAGTRIGDAFRSIEAGISHTAILLLGAEGDTHWLFTGQQKPCGMPRSRWMAFTMILNLTSLVLLLLACGGQWGKEASDIQNLAWFGHAGNLWLTPFGYLTFMSTNSTLQNKRVPSYAEFKSPSSSSSLLPPPSAPSPPSSSSSLDISITSPMIMHELVVTSWKMCCTSLSPESSFLPSPPSDKSALSWFSGDVPYGSRRYDGSSSQVGDGGSDWRSDFVPLPSVMQNGESGSNPPHGQWKRDVCWWCWKSRLLVESLGILTALSGAVQLALEWHRLASGGDDSHGITPRDEENASHERSDNTENTDTNDAFESRRTVHEANSNSSSEDKREDRLSAAALALFGCWCCCGMVASFSGLCAGAFLAAAPTSASFSVFIGPGAACGWTSACLRGACMVMHWALQAGDPNQPRFPRSSNATCIDNDEGTSSLPLAQASWTTIPAEGQATAVDALGAMSTCNNTATSEVPTGTNDSITANVTATSHIKNFNEKIPTYRAAGNGNSSSESTSEVNEKWHEHMHSVEDNSASDAGFHDSATQDNELLPSLGNSIYKRHPESSDGDESMGEEEEEEEEDDGGEEMKALISKRDHLADLMKKYGQEDVNDSNAEESDGIESTYSEEDESEDQPFFKPTPRSSEAAAVAARLHADNKRLQESLRIL